MYINIFFTETTTCKGASGGGLYFLSDNKQYYIRGIVSITARFEGMCSPNTYSLYTKVSNYLSWINRTITLI